MVFRSFIVLFFQFLLVEIGSTINQANDLSIEDTVVNLKNKLSQMEERMSSFERSLAVQDSQKGCMEDKNEILKKVSEVEMRCADISARLTDAEVRFLKMDTHLLLEIQQIRDKSSETIQRVQTVEQEKDILQVKMNKTLETLNSFVNSQRNTENVIGKNTSSSTEELRHLNDSLSSKLETLSTKMRIFENSLLEIEKDYTNTSFVSKLDKRLQDIEKVMKTDIQSILSDRMKQLEERCAVCGGIAEKNKTLRSHSSQTPDLSDIQNSCPDPPRVENGYPLLGNNTNPDRKNGAIVKYACRGNRTMVGSGEIVCCSGKWTGDLPECMNSCNTEDLKGYDGLDIPMNKITEHSKSLSIRCHGGYIIFSTSITCLNGTWNVSDNPCMKESCDGEPPSIRNGKTIYFERKFGSSVEYECNQNYVLTGNTTVHCKWGLWQGEPPVCSFFDATFFLWTWTTWDWYYCYSKDSYQKIDFSRELDTGSGQHLPGGFTKTIGARYALFKFGKDASQRGGPFGAFQCGYSDARGSMNVVVHKQDASSGLYFSDPFKVANIGDTVDLKVNFKKEYLIRWKHNAVDIPSWNNKSNVEISSVKPTDAGTYECYYEGKRGEIASALLRLTVRKCKKNLFGKNCDQQCPPCYNGGICHDHLGVCICPSGFYGNNCEGACSKSRTGVNCSVGCHYVGCKGSLFCQPDPHGCACARGWKGINCNLPCATGWYGADCKQPCHCAVGPERCNTETGACSRGCSPGWTGESCQIEERRRHK